MFIRNIPSFKVNYVVITGRGFGQVKCFHPTGNNVPLTTPRRALGDVGNTLMTPGNFAKKSSILKPSHQNNILQSTTPGARKITQGTPHGRVLSKQFGSSLKQNKKQGFQVRVNPSTNEKNSVVVEKGYFKKENMIPFTDEGKYEWKINMNNFVLLNSCYNTHTDYIICGQVSFIGCQSPEVFMSCNSAP